MKFISESKEAEKISERAEFLIFPFYSSALSMTSSERLVLVFPCSNSFEGKIKR